MNCGYYSSSLNEEKTPQSINKELTNLFERDKGICKILADFYINSLNNGDVKNEVLRFKKEYTL